MVSKKVFKLSQNAFTTKQCKTDNQLFLYFRCKKSIEKFQIYQKRTFHLNKAHYLKPYIGSSVYMDQYMQEDKYTSNQVGSCQNVFQSKSVRLVYRN